MDKTWAEDPPSRSPYDSLYQQPDAEEENTDKFFIALIVVFVLGLCYCASHMWRTHKAHKLRLEKETDEKIMRSKEKATKLQEPSVSFIQLNGDDKKTEENGEEQPPKSNGVIIDGVPTIIVEVIPEEKPIRRGSLRFRDMIDIELKPLEEKDEPSENEDEEEASNENKVRTILDNSESKCQESKTNSNVYRIPKESARGPPTLTTPLPFKIDEHGSNEMLTGNA